MYLAYVDDSGDSGYGAGTSKTFTLGCVFLEAADWPDGFDAMIGLRRLLRARFGVPIRAEIKAHWLIRNTHAFAQLELAEDLRRRIYRMHMRIVPKIKAQAFAVVIRKDLINQRQRDPHDIAWEYLLQRLERLTTTSGKALMLLHDEGNAGTVRKLARKARRAGTAGSAFGTGYLKLPARLLVDDPVPKDSSQSYFIQLADMCAYAAFRRLYPPPPRRTSCPTTMWDELGAARFARANGFVTSMASGHPGGLHPGIVVWP